MNKALVRHEVTHSIQASKRGSKITGRLRDFLGDEIRPTPAWIKASEGGSKATRNIGKAKGMLIRLHWWSGWKFQAQKAPSPARQTRCDWCWGADRRSHRRISSKERQEKMK